MLTEGIDWLKSQESSQYAAIEKANKENEKVSKAASKLQEIEQRLEVFRHEITQSRQKLHTCESRIALMEDEIKNVSQAEELMNERDQIKGQLDTLKEQRSIKQEEIRDLLFSNPWVPLGTKLLKLQADIEERISNARELESALTVRRGELNFLEKIGETEHCPLCLQSARPDEQILSRINEIKSEIESAQVEDLEGLLEVLRHLQNAHISSGVLTEARNLRKEYDSLGSQIAFTTQSLEAKIQQLNLLGDKDVQTVLTSIRALLQDQSEAESEIKDYEEKIEDCEKEANAQRRVISGGQGVDPSLRIKYQSYGYLAELFDAAKAVYAQQIKLKVQEYASETFLKIISDSKYRGLRINENYGMDLMMEGGVIDTLKSTGQGKVSTIALVSGLIRTAMSEGFILMDTPFVSLDKGHREAVCRWAASSGLYISFFMHSGEYNEDQILEYLGGKIGRVYRIQRIDDNESTISIEQDIP